ncbi:MAG TPA: helix-turn-helix domain-containing protein [Gemmatimonadaceae bacterium]
MPVRRTSLQARADEASDELARKLGRMLRDGRLRLRLKQAEATARAGLSPSEWSVLELGRSPATVPTINRAAFAVGGSLDAWIKETSAADRPRDAVHLRHQELIIRLSTGGAWQPLPEEFLDREARTSRAADVLLTRRPTDRPREYALWEVSDWIEDAGAVVRDFTRRLAAVDRYAVARMQDAEPVPSTGGCWLVRATQRNRTLIAEHRHFFRARFSGSGRAWLAALTKPRQPLPTQPALLWVSVNGERIFPARLG